MTNHISLIFLLLVGLSVAQNDLVPIPGSEPPNLQDYTLIGPHPTGTVVNITVVLVDDGGDAEWKIRMEKATSKSIHNRQFSNKDDFERSHNRSQTAKPIRKFASDSRLKVIKYNPWDILVNMQGTVEALNNAFGITLNLYRNSRGELFRGYSGPIKIPSELSSIVATVVGLNNFTIATRTAPGRFIPLDSLKRARTSRPYTADQVARMYNFPTGVDGTGQCIGIVQFGGGMYNSDLGAMGAVAGMTKYPSVYIVSVGGATNNVNSTSSANQEVALDLQIVAAIAPGARIIIYFAPNSGQGMLDAYSTMINDVTSCGNGQHLNVISVSWGFPDLAPPNPFRESFEALLSKAVGFGITITVASGDHGSYDGQSAPTVNYPSASSYTLACGGTTLAVSQLSTGPSITSEVVWNTADGWGTGGGVSKYARPAWQAATYGSTSLTGRGVPDVAGMADPNGVGFYVVVNGQAISAGGTSAVSPLWAGYIALLNQNLASKRIGFMNNLIYSLPSTSRASAFRDITSGHNQVYTGKPINYAAQVGWDACTGWGTPNGVGLMNALMGSSTRTPTPTPAPTPAIAVPQPQPKPAPQPLINCATVSQTATDSSTASPSVSNGATAAIPGWAIALLVLAGLILVTLLAILIVVIRKPYRSEHV